MSTNKVLRNFWVSRKDFDNSEHDWHSGKILQPDCAMGYLAYMYKELGKYLRDSP